MDFIQLGYSSLVSIFFLSFFCVICVFISFNNYSDYVHLCTLLPFL